MSKLEQITVNGIGLTLSKIVWRRFRRPTPGVVEATLAANPGLADHGPVFPLGTVFDLVVPPEASAKEARPVVRLWGASS